MVEGSSRRSYTRQAQIGEGTYGEVYVGTCLATSEKVALKKIRMDNEKEGFPITAIREIKLLKMLDHDNVITLKEIVRSQGECPCYSSKTHSQPSSSKTTRQIKAVKPTGISLQATQVVGTNNCLTAAHTANNMKGSIYMVFDYMDHDLTGLMERRNYKMEVPHVSGKCSAKI